MIKRFKTFIAESLSDEQKEGFRNYASYNFGHYIPDEGPSYEGLKISKHIMPEGTDSIVIPAMNSLVQRVHDHLNTHGYTMDYGKQEAYKDGRTIKIGKVLSRTNAPKELMNKFAGDNHQESAEFSKNNAILISRDPNHIAECSTNKPWSSCARLDDDGEPEQRGHDGKLAAQLLPNEIMSGTHVAYLVKNDPSKSHQELVDGAKARILLKPFYNSRTNKKILVPEGKSYSNSDQVPSGFRETVNNFTDKHFPIETNTEYTKSSGLYNDDGVRSKINLDLDKPIGYLGGDYSNAEKFSNQRHISSEQITKFMDDVKNNPNHPNADHLDFVPHLPNFGDEHLAHFLQPENWSKLSYHTQKHLLQKKMNSANHKALSDNLYKDLHDPTKMGDNRIFDYVSNPATKSEHIKRLLTHPFIQNPDHANATQIRNMLAESSKLNGQDLMDVVKLHMNSNIPNLYHNVIKNPNIDKSHINELLKRNLYSPINVFGGQGASYRNIVALNDSDKFSSDDISNVLDKVTSGSHDDFTKHTIFHSVLFNENLNHHHLDKILSHLKPDNDASLLRYPLDAGFRNNRFEDEDKMHEVLLNHYKTNDNLHHLLPGIAPFLNKENLDKLLETPEKISKALTSNNIIHSTLYNKNLDSSHLFKMTQPSLFNGLMSSTKNRITRHPEFTSEHLSDMIDNIGNYSDGDKSDIINHPKFNTSDMGYSSQRDNEPNHFDYITEPKKWNTLPEHIKIDVLSHPKATPENIKNMKNRMHELSPNLQARLAKHPLYNQ